MRSSLRRIGVITIASFSLVAAAALPAFATPAKPMPAKIKVTSVTCLPNHLASVNFFITLKNSPTHRVTSAWWYADGSAPDNNSLAIPNADPKLLTTETTTASFVFDEGQSGLNRKHTLSALMTATGTSKSSTLHVTLPACP